MVTMDIHALPTSTNDERPQVSRDDRKLVGPELLEASRELHGRNRVLDRSHDSLAEGVVGDLAAHGEFFLGSMTSAERRSMLRA